MANEVSFYAGPGEDYPVVATVFGGFNYPVIGISEDGQWWKLPCYDNNNNPMEQCWVSAESNLTSPTQKPPL